MSEVVAVTIGQSPRTDIQPILEKYIGTHSVVQMGLLDNISDDEFRKLTTVKTEDEVYVSKMVDDSEVILSAEMIERKMTETIKTLKNKGVRQVLLLCTGNFSDIPSNIRVYVPEQLISPTISVIGRDSKVGIIIPNKDQKRMMEKKWNKYDFIPMFEGASPYTEVKNIVEAGKKLKDRGAEYLLMDCMGYTEEMKSAVKKETNLPVVLSTALMAKVLSELLV